MTFDRKVFFLALIINLGVTNGAKMVPTVPTVLRIARAKTTRPAARTRANAPALTVGREQTARNHVRPVPGDQIAPVCAAVTTKGRAITSRARAPARMVLSAPIVRGVNLATLV